VTVSTTDRVASIDALRGLAMMGLVLVHAILYLTSTTDTDNLVYVVFVFVLGDVGAALFTMLVGASFVLSERRQAGVAGRAIVLRAVVRGLFLVAAGMLVSIVTTGPVSVFEWDILPLIGVASIVVALVRRVPSWALVLTCAAIALLSPLVRSLTGYLQWWGGAMTPEPNMPIEGLLLNPIGDFAPGLDAMAALWTAVSTGWFPIFPWLMFPLLGMVLGRQLADRRPQAVRLWLSSGGVLLVAGLTTATVTAANGSGDPVSDILTPLSWTPNSTSMVAVQSGLVLIVMAVAHAALDARAVHRRWLGVVGLYSRYALSVYIWSYVVIFMPIHVADLVDPPASHMYALWTTTWSLLCGVALVALFYPVLVAFDRHNGAGSFEWLMGHARRRAGPSRHHETFPAPGV
jgi:uncharacterized membrane protein